MSGGLRKLAGAFLLAWGLCSSAIATPLADQPRSYPFKDQQGGDAIARLPWIVGGEPGIAERINTYVYDAFLHTLPSTDAKAITSAIDPGTMSIDSNGIRAVNGGRMVVVSLELSICGAHCGDSTFDYYFDAANGRPVEALDLVTPDAKATLLPKAHKARSVTMQKHIAELRKRIKKGKDKSDAEEQLVLYENCLEREEQASAGDFGYLLIRENRLVLRSMSCGSYSVRAIDELGDFEYVLKGEEMRPYLNPYGRKLMLGEGGAAAPQTGKSAQLYKGTINGNLAVTLFVGEATSQEAHYYYDKYRKQIALAVQRQGGQITFTERDKDGNTTGVMTLKQSGAKLSGEWRSGAKRMPVEFSAY